MDGVGRKKKGCWVKGVERSYSTLPNSGLILRCATESEFQYGNGPV